MLYNGPGLVTSGANLGGYATPSFFSIFFDYFSSLSEGKFADVHDDVR